jgi:predicted nucleic acid-binding protein
MIDLDARVFVDSNVFVYRLDASEPEKRAVADEYVRRLWEKRNGRLSVQVLNELYVTVTAKLDPGLDHASARRCVESLLAWRPIPLDSRLVRASFAVRERYQLAWWDSLIVAASQRADCRYLLSEDLQAGQKFDGVEVVNPFAPSSED